MPSWEEIEEELLYRDGSVRDVYVLEGGPDDWKRLLEALPDSSWSYTFTWEGQPQPLPRTFSEARSREGTALLSIDKNGLWLNCHFFNETEIEFDFRPEEIKSPQVFERLHAFLSWLADLLQKDVIITPENTSDDIILTVTPVSRED
jgi:hypothetical protein